MGTVFKAGQVWPVLFAAGVVVGLLLGGGLVYASIPGPGGVISPSVVFSRESLPR
jgi:hypothetical protein